MADASLRGRCREMAEAAAADDPTLVVVRGWYDDLQWGAQEHWWCEQPDGTIVDPTAAQFPCPGIASRYRKYEGVYPCSNCGAETAEADLVGDHPCCSWSCYGEMVGVPCG